MTHQNHQTNGASLEDCHTNFFALTDLCGIKWRKFVNGERPNASSDPLEDPILRSYSRCMQADILCVWRRVQSTKQDTLDPNALSFEISSSKIHPPLSLAAAKELWIFWYGEEPDLNDLVDADLLRVAANQMLWNGTWEKGLTYECRSLLFKALHNLMERFVLTKDIVRFGKWFVQPCTSNERIFGKSSQHLSFSFTFFVHGDTVCASIDLREHPAVRPLTKEHLAQAGAAFAAAAFPTTTQSGCSGVEQHNSSNNNNNNSRSGMLPPDDGLLLGSNGVAVNENVAPLKPRKVILAPFGMAATLTGNSYKATDPMAEKILEDWASFFPLCNKENSDIPPVVEVVSGGHKMYHPSMYVLVTDLDDMEELETTNCNGNPLDATCSSAEAAVLTAAATAGLSSTNTNITTTVGGVANTRTSCAGKMTQIKTTDSTVSATSLEQFDASTKFQPYYETLANFTCNTTNTHASPQAAIEMPERAWQDCITSSLLATTTAATVAAAALSSNNNHNNATTITTTSNATGVSIKQEHIKMEVVEGEEGANQDTAMGGDANAGAASAASSSNNSNAVVANAAELKYQQQTQQQKKLWNFVDPTQKAPCICTKCYTNAKKQPTGTSSVTGPTSTGSTLTLSSATSIACRIPTMALSKTYSSSCSSQQQQQAYRSTTITNAMSTVTDSNKLTARYTRIPFHKRQHLSCVETTADESNNNNNISSNNSRRSTSDNNSKAKISKISPSAREAIFYSSFSSTTTTSTCFSGGTGTGGTLYYASSDTIPSQRSSPLHPASAVTPGGTPQGGASSYSRNSIGDSMPVPSVGSPSTPAPSPHPNSSLSQPTSVPPADQLMSPRAPTSVSNLHQPPTPIDHLLLDKNTPAPTPTDQHDNKSITTSPYVQPAPSVEPPPSAEAALVAGSGMGPGSVPPPSSVERCTPTIGQQQQQQQQQQQLQQQQQQQQCGLITVKKFETQLQTLTSIGGSSIPAVGVASETTSNHFAAASAAMVDFLSLYKPPKLSTKDIDSQANDDCLKLETLYDFTVQDAWVNHPVKRFKPNDIVKPCRPLRTKNLYDGHTHFKPLMPSPGSVYGTQLLMVGNANNANSIGGTARNQFAGSGGLVGIASTHLTSIQEAAMGDNINHPGELFAAHDIKLEGGVGRVDGGSAKSPCKEAKGVIGGNLFTAEGLNPSMNDLEQLFDTSSNEECGGVQIHTPPDSNNPSNGCAATNTIDDLKRSTAVVSAVLASANSLTGNVGVAALQNCVAASGGGGVGASSIGAGVGNNGNSSNLNNNLGGANVIQAEDLTTMFPTPPSHEQHHPNSSPCQMDISMTDLSVVTSTTTMLTTSIDVCLSGGGGMMKIKQQQQEYSVELGSPVEEPIDDWSYVYRPPQQSKFVGSSKYAPLTNLPSQTLPPLMVPVNCVYKPSWTSQQARAAVQQQQQQQQQHQHQQQQQHHHHQQQQQQQLQQHQQQQQQHHHQQLQELLSAAPRTPLQQPRTPLGPMPSPSPIPQPLNSAGSNLLLNQLNCPQAALTNATVGGPTMQQLMQRAGMSPISPAAATVPFPSGSPMLHHHPQQRRTTPIHPPPPYEVAVASPATSTSSYLNKQFHSQEPQPRTPQSVGAHATHISGGHSHNLAVAGSGNMLAASAAHAQRYPEISSLIVNVLLYDTALNVFRDHNFDSSTVCVCNADSQKVGNIRGADSGVYVPLPGSSFNPGTSAMVSAANGSAANGNNMRLLSAFGGGGGAGSGGSALHSPASVPGAGSGHAGSNSSSSFTPTTTAAGGGAGNNQHINGYYDEDPVECTCGFSAVVNRRLAHRAGLFYEDELEITGIAEDPGRIKKRSLLSIITSLTLALRPTSNNSLLPAPAGDLEKHSAASPLQGDLLLANSIFDLLLEQCSIIQTSSSSIHRALQRYRRRLTKAAQTTKQPPQSMVAIANVLEFVDANDIICLALEQARIAAAENSDYPAHQQHSQHHHHQQQQQQLAHLNLGLMRKHSLAPTVNLGVHKWPYIPAGFTRSNKDIVRTMNAIQPMLQNAFHSKSRSAAGTKDATYTVSGPLTWRQFHRLAGRASGQCEPQPIPSVIVGQDKDWVSVAPLAIHYWDKFLLEPYSYARDVVYLIICPDNDYVIGKTRSYFKELSSTYEMCKLGRHTPMRGWDGLLSVGPKPAVEKLASATTPLDDWLRTLEDTSLAEKIRLYALAFQNMLLPYLNRVPGDKTLLNPPDSQSDGRCGSSSSSGSGRERSTTSPMHGNSSSSNNSTTLEAEKPSNSPPPQPKHEPHSSTNETEPAADVKTDVKGDGTKPLIFGDPLGAADTMEDINPPAIVLYVVEPFTYGSDSPELERLACIALLRCYAELLKAIPDAVRANINLQIISLESMLELGRARNRKRYSDEIKCLALNIFSQCRRHMVHGQTVKSLTGFGTAANMEVFLKSKDEKNRQPYKMYTPPFILAPMHEKNEKTDFSRTNSGMRNFNEQQYSVMYCNYCMSEDQSWLLATVTDNRGELLEKVCINIDVPNRTRRRKAPARRVGLKKLMDFIIGIISQTAQPWRLVIGRIGRIGHSELKSWSYLLSKQSLQKVTKQLKDMCKQCNLMYPPSILSACLVTLEPDAKLRVMPDQFTPDERFSQISMQNPLSTPQDVTCTHILVFPTSAVCLSFTRQFQNEPQVDIDNDFLNFDEFDEENDGCNNEDLMGAILGTWDNYARSSPQGSPGRMEDNRSWQSSGGNNFNSAQQQDIEEVGSINQQPLAVGYMVSTAPTGRMPAWFWSACPHLEDVCPVFLKTALHLHVPNIQTADDTITVAHSSATDHPLDSTLTADVLRYVLEGYNALSWLALDSNTHDRLSCLPINVQTLMDLYYLTAAIA